LIIAPEKHVFLRLATSARVARLIGFQVYPIAVPKNADPAVLHLQAERTSQARRTSTGPMFQPLVSLQIASWALNYDGARELADEVRLALDGATGTLAGVTIEDIRLVSETDDFLDPTAVGAQLPPAYEVRQLYQIRWQEATG
jgi:hypothetical protein